LIIIFNFWPPLFHQILLIRLCIEQLIILFHYIRIQTTDSFTQTAKFILIKDISSMTIKLNELIVWNDVLVQCLRKI
jgi:hypothetical protein